MENWKDIQGFEGLYQISDMGRVKSIERAVTCGKGRRVVKERIKRPGMQNKGYVVYNLFKNSKCCPRLLHALIAKHFIDNPNNYPEVNHLNGIKTDNRIENLEWVTYSMNIKHAYDTGLRKRRSPSAGKLGADNHLSKPIAQYDLSGNLIKEWPCSKEVWRATGLNHHCIRRCANGTVKTAYGFTWKFI
jgi:hypothetical protein